MTAGLLAALSMVVYLGGAVANQAAFAAPQASELRGQPNANANLVALSTTASQGNFEICKTSQPAQECATGENNIGEFTSFYAQNENGP